MNDSSWSWAVELTSRFLNKPARLSHLLERLPPSMDPGSRRRCQFLLFGVVRHWSFLESNLDAFMKKRPRLGTWASLLVASYELLANPEKSAQIVDHAVGGIGKRFSVAEKSLANAVLRKVASVIQGTFSETPKDAAAMAIRYSHPKWLVDRWISQFGFEDTLRFAKWNQAEPEIYFLPLGDETKIGELGQLTEWPPYRRAPDTSWADLSEAIEQGAIYIQNPGTRLAPDLLAKHFTRGRILDLCAAPGGKSFYLDKMLPAAQPEILAVDLPGPRFERLVSNIDRFGSGRISSLASDLFDLEASQLGLFDAVLLDAPCSNSGVLQKKPDAKWRMAPAQIAELIELQFRMLVKSSAFVGREGLLVYSTCSVDPEENKTVVDRFLAADAGQPFQIVSISESFPWLSGHDGAGAYLLRRES